MLKGVIAIIIIIASVCFFRGHRKIDEYEKFKQSLKDNNNLTHVIENLAYHGGLPSMPKIQRLNAGLSRKDLVLYDYHGNWSKIQWSVVKNIEKIRTGSGSKSKPYDYSLWGSLLPMFGPMFRKREGRYFIAINYIDCDQDDNHLLLECTDLSQQTEVVNVLNDTWKMSTMIAG